MEAHKKPLAVKINSSEDFQTVCQAVIISKKFQLESATKHRYNENNWSEYPYFRLAGDNRVGNCHGGGPSTPTQCVIISMDEFLDYIREKELVVDDYDIF